jgi:MinD superfamily P-loop ATPase
MAGKKIAVLSGKGGTGKTLVAVNLAAAAKNACYVDCDVEAPDGKLFFRPEIAETKEVCVLVPRIDLSECTACKVCVEFCRFHALAFGKKPVVFDEVCHSCGGCALVCPQKAIKETARIVGMIEKGVSEGVQTFCGSMNMGEATGVSVIRQLMDSVKNETRLTVIDCPPGSACSVMESIREADYCVLVAEPTVFGAHNLAMVYELALLFKKPCGVVLNKCGDGNNPSREFCLQNGIGILAEIPFDSALGKLNSEGKIAVRVDYPKKELFFALLARVREAAE